MLKNKNGFTLIEMLVALGLSALVTSLVITFFVTNIKTYKELNDEAELQFQVQYILNFMSDKIMESDSISLVKNSLDYYSMTSIRAAGSMLPAEKISFKFGEGASENYVFQVINKNIRYGSGGKDISPTVELGSYVKAMHISLLNSECLKNVKVFKIILLLEKGNQSFRAEQVFCFRNNNSEQ
ncbi:PilW family protein [Sedimentibacter saalensis]|uniref:PilW family protein n=1 Tax=Sedimentibacter saalensis TaxID=130788 RepID=UPI00289DD731|nr:prepilin-type N-terminal cleavage/methylation domain-containing protein [Sedimentibacter saalensis]